MSLKMKNFKGTCEEVAVVTTSLCLELGGFWKQERRFATDLAYSTVNYCPIYLYAEDKVFS
jgi:hypothetical protein